MLQEQFYYRLLLIIGFGIIYVKTMMKMAQYKPAEEATSKHVVMKVVGGLFVLLAIFEAVMGVYLITQVQHPTEMITFVPNPNQIVRPSSSHIIWGYTTTAQWQIISQISNAMTSLGWGAYFLFYRKSASVWWKKVLKFVFALLFCMFYYSATDFHYFDSWEWIVPGLFAIMVWIVRFRVKKSLRQKVITPQEVLESHPIEEPVETESSNQQEDVTRFMPQPATENTSAIETKSESDRMAAEEKIKVEETSVHRYCRYCGKKIDYEGVKFCKHCGKPID